MSRARAATGNHHCGIYPPASCLFPPLSSSSSLPPLFFSLLLCAFQKSSFCVTAGLPPHAHRLRCARSKGGSRSSSMVNFNSFQHYRYFHTPALLPLPPPSSCCAFESAKVRLCPLVKSD
ncbi:hypothetical protein AMECASPLE_005647 [Ameca splendens]|uniref:Secreted protein n=1 Tax=Ameca splendens TaxID=208324 RepID=A0ABV0YYW9_9TELE